MATVRNLLGGSYAVGYTGSVPSITFATDPLFQVGEAVTFAFQAPLGQGLPTDSVSYAVRVPDAGSDVRQPVAGGDMPEISVSQLQLQGLMSHPASIVFDGTVEAR